MQIIHRYTSPDSHSKRRSSRVQYDRNHHEPTSSSRNIQHTTSSEASTLNQSKEEPETPEQREINEIAERIAGSRTVDALATDGVRRWLPGVTSGLRGQIIETKLKSTDRITQQFAKAEANDNITINSIAEVLNIFGSEKSCDYFFTEAPRIIRPTLEEIPEDDPLDLPVSGITNYAAVKVTNIVDRMGAKKFTPIGFIEILIRKRRGQEKPELCHLFLRSRMCSWDTTTPLCAVPVFSVEDKDQPRVGPLSKEVPIEIATNIFGKIDNTGPDGRKCTMMIDESRNIILKLRYPNLHLTTEIKIYNQKYLDMQKTLMSLMKNGLKYAFTPYDPQRRRIPGTIASKLVKLVIERTRPSTDKKFDVDPYNVGTWTLESNQKVIEKAQEDRNISKKKALESLASHDIPEIMNIFCNDEYAKEYFFEVTRKGNTNDPGKRFYFAFASLSCFVCEENGKNGRVILHRGLIEITIRVAAKDNEGNPLGNDTLHHMRFRDISKLVEGEKMDNQSTSTKYSNPSSHMILCPETSITAPEHIFGPKILGNRTCRVRTSSNNSITLCYYEDVQQHNRTMKLGAGL